jgi:hypothetical protein
MYFCPKGFSGVRTHDRDRAAAEIGFIQRYFGIGASQVHNAVFSKFYVELVAQVHGLKNGLDFVKTVMAPLQDLEGKVDLGAGYRS